MGRITVLNQFQIKMMLNDSWAVFILVGLKEGLILGACIITELYNFVRTKWNVTRIIFSRDFYSFATKRFCMPQIINAAPTHPDFRSEILKWPLGKGTDLVPSHSAFTGSESRRGKHQRCKRTIPVDANQHELHWRPATRPLIQRLHCEIYLISASQKLTTAPNTAYRYNFLIRICRITSSLFWIFTTEICLNNGWSTMK
jgi:hypothetical protein